MINPFIRFTNNDTIKAISSELFILKLGARLENLRINKCPLTLTESDKVFATLGIVEFHSCVAGGADGIVAKHFKFTSIPPEEFMLCRFDRPDAKIELVGPDLKSYLEDNLILNTKFSPIGNDKYALVHYDFFLAHRT